jgi:hypothetical protein
MAWAPAIFLCIDKLFDTGAARWGLAGIAAAAMSILNGCDQLTYYIGLFAGLYAMLRMSGIFAQWARRRRRQAVGAPARPWWHWVGVVAMLLLLYTGGAAVSAIQLLPTLGTTPETIRKNGLSYEMASSCPVPPESLLTLVAPDFMGGLPPPQSPDSYLHPKVSEFLGGVLSDDAKVMPYYGRWYPWEVISFLGVGGLALAAFGAVGGQKPARRFMAALAILSGVLMLGKHTPLYDFLYHHLPLYGTFRSTNRFNLLTAMFVAVLAGAGLDGLLQRKSVPWVFAGVLVCVGLILAGGSLWLTRESNLESSGRWGAAMHAVANGGDAPFANKSDLLNDEFIRRAGLHAAHTLVLPACLFAISAAAVGLTRFWRPLAYVIAIMAATEVFVYAWASTCKGPTEAPLSTGWRDAIAKLDPDDRIMSTSAATADLGMEYGYHDAYGYDPFVLNRYAEFLAAIQMDLDPHLGTLLQRGLNWVPPVVIHATRSSSSANQLDFQFSSRLALLRCRDIFATLNTSKGPQPLNFILHPLVRRLQLVSDWQLKPNRDDLFAAINEQRFDPTKTVLLETKPDPIPVTMNEPGTVGAVDTGTDSMEITADLPGPQILLITDAYARDWRARPLDSGGQQTYQVLPADYLFRAIPLAAGHHHFVLEYVPQSYIQGRRITLLALLLWALGWIWLFLRRGKRPIAQRPVPAVEVAAAPKPPATRGAAAAPPKWFPIPEYDGFRQARNPSRIKRKDLPDPKKKPDDL